MSWIDEELAGCVFVDSRLGKRLVSLVSKLSDKIGSTIPIPFPKIGGSAPLVSMHRAWCCSTCENSTEYGFLVTYL
jgi:hypothetical protein